jgi:hypothetical protein
VNPFIGLSREKLESALAARQEDLLAASALVRTKGGDVEQQSQLINSTERTIELILRALNRIAPLDYPDADIARNDRVKITY